MDIILWIILGAVAGWIASMIAGTDAQQGWLMNIIVGILGAVVGGWIVSFLLPGAAVGGFNLVSLLIAIFGAVVLLAIYKLVAQRA